MHGQGEFAALIRHRFAIACRRLGLNADRNAALDTTRFRPPARARAATPQLDLFQGP
jgi:hypothetical protein